MKYSEYLSVRSVLSGASNPIQLPGANALREAAIQRYRSDMKNAGHDTSAISDQYIATPALQAGRLSVKAFLAGRARPGIEGWSETRISNTSSNAWESQGVSHNSRYWYFVQRNEVFSRRLPIRSDGSIDKTRPWAHKEKVHNVYFLNSTSDASSVTINGVYYNHLGAPCYYKDDLYVPLEGHKKSSPALVVKYSKELVFLDAMPLVFMNPITKKYQIQGQAGWVAIDPKCRCMYTSMEGKYFDEGACLGGGHVIMVYSLEKTVQPKKEEFQASSDTNWLKAFDGWRFLKWLGVFPIASFSHFETMKDAHIYVNNTNYRRPEYPLDGVAGGVVDEGGNLWLSLGEDYQEDPRGNSKGRIICMSGIDGTPLGSRVSGTGCNGWGCEAEGITIWNGELFLVTLHNGSSDNMNFHVISPPSESQKWTKH
jgi:hypothetical protein